MDKFTFYSPTKFCFGKNAEDNLGELLDWISSRKVMIFHMSGPELRSGILDRVKETLAEGQIEFVEAGGVKANPRLDYTLKCIETAKEEKVLSAEEAVLIRPKPLQQGRCAGMIFGSTSKKIFRLKRHSPLGPL